MNKIFAAILSVTLLFGATMSANAAEASVLLTVEQSDINTAVTVPGQIPIIFNADGTNTYPTNWKISNTGEYTGVYLDYIKAEENSSGWELLGESEDLTKLSHDTQAFKFYMGKPENLKIFKPLADGGGSISFAENERISIPAGSSQLFGFKMERGVFNTARAEHIALKITLNFAYN